MKPIGKQLTIDMYGCAFDDLNNPAFIESVMMAALNEAHLTLLNFVCHRFEPYGLTALALLSESHMTVHTYPELGYAAIDVFACGEDSRPDKALNVFRSFLKPEKTKATRLIRGDFGSTQDMKPRIKTSVTPLRRVRNTGARVLRFLSRNNRS
ncbi:MAG TPA: adenosylmethionine decarboxylase [Patescibacteria group bacterium]|nr:adenosylmethionine decarboxylase [Patescibacteria group bacterium]